jgi:hypothetical protein
MEPDFYFCPAPVSYNLIRRKEGLGGNDRRQ